MILRSQCGRSICIIAPAGGLGLQITPIIPQGYSTDESRIHIVVGRALCLVGRSTVGRERHVVDMALLLWIARSWLWCGIGVGNVLGGFGRSYSSYRRQGWWERGKGRRRGLSISRRRQGRSCRNFVESELGGRRVRLVGGGAEGRSGLMVGLVVDLLVVVDLVVVRRNSRTTLSRGARS